MDIFLLIGVLGMMFILYAFFMNQTNRWKNSSLQYDTVNFIGSLFLVIYALPPLAWPFLILNGVWAAVSLKDVISDLKRRR